MAFIQAITANGVQINISAEHIMSVRAEGTGSVIGMAVATENGLFTYHVKETVSEVTGRTEVALAYRRRG